MKKILLSLFAVLCTMGAWAEVAQLKVSTNSQKYYYVIKNFRSGKFACYNGDEAQLLQSVNPTIETAEADVNKYLWYVTEADGEGAYMLHNVATTKVYAAYNSFTDAGAVVYIKENPYKSGYVCVSNNADATTKNSCWDDQGSHTKIGPYEPRQNDNEGTSWSFIETTQGNLNYSITDNAENVYTGTYSGWSNLTLPVSTATVFPFSNLVFSNQGLTATINFPFPVSKVDGATNWTFIKTKPISSNEAYFYVNNDEVKFKTQKNANLSYLPSSDVNEIAKYMWAIYPKFNSVEGKFTFNIKNSASNKFMPVAESAVNSIQMSETAGDYCWGAANSGFYGFHIPNNSDVFLNAGTSNPNEQTATLWNKTANTGHQGINLVFTDPIYWAACNITDNAGGEYSCLETINYTLDENDVERPAAIAGVWDTWITNVGWNEGECNLVVTFPFPVSNSEELNATQIANFNATQKWNAVGTDVKVQTIGTPASSEIATSLWGIYPTYENGGYTYKIKNLATQSWVIVNKTTSSFDTQGTVILGEEGTKLDIINWLGSPCFKVNGQTLYLTINGSADKDVYLATWSGGNDGHGGNKLHFPNATYNVTVGETRFVSLYTPIAGTIAGDVKTYAIKETGSTYANLEELSGIAANQGAIIEAAPGTYTFTAGTVTSDWSGNLLKGSSVNTYVAGSAYVLSAPNGVESVGLYKATLNKNENGEAGDTHFQNNAGKAYLPASVVPSGARFLNFDFGGNETAIDELKGENGNVKTVIYDLAGRRVQGAQKGIYVVNGKVVIK